MFLRLDIKADECIKRGKIIIAITVGRNYYVGDLKCRYTEKTQM